MTISAIIGNGALSLIFAVALTFPSCASAQSPLLQKWSQWNSRTRTIFPDKNWSRYGAPEEAGWSSGKLAEAHQTSIEAGSAAVLAVYNGAILAQWGETSRRFKCHSIRKSLVSALYGPAVSAGIINLEETIGSIGVDDIDHLTSTEKMATIADLLKSRSGIYLPAALKTPVADQIRPERGSHRPGTHWYYNNWDFNTLGTIYTRKTGVDLFKAFKTEFADPLQMQDFDLRHTHYYLDQEISLHPGYLFRMSARDLARFGLLFLNDGKWQNKQIIPSKWIDESTRTYSITASGGYGYMWWTEIGFLRELGTYTAYGYGGHAVFIIPGARLVVVHRANSYDGKHVLNRSIRKIVRQILRARTQPPRARPVMVTLSDPSAPTPRLVLTAAEMAKLSGRFRRGKRLLTVRTSHGRLELDSPFQGRFFLNPSSRSEFQLEDINWRLKFTLDKSGKPVKMHIWPANGAGPYEFTPAP